MAEKEYIERETAIKAAVNGLRGVPSVAALEMIEALEDAPSRAAERRMIWNTKETD